MREAFLAGVVACLRKPVEARVLEGAVHRAVDATLVMRRCIQDAAVSMAAMETPSCPHDTSMLTPREQEILELLTHGRSTRSMAQALDVSQRTVKFHVSNVLRKLGADSRISLLAKLRRTSW